MIAMTNAFRNFHRKWKLFKKKKEKDEEVPSDVETFLCVKSTRQASIRKDFLHDMGKSCVRIYGDTFTVAFCSEGKIYRNCRCRYDSPEMRGNDKEAAIAARDFCKICYPRKYLDFKYVD